MYWGILKTTDTVDIDIPKLTHSEVWHAFYIKLMKHLHNKCVCVHVFLTAPLRHDRTHSLSKPL